MGRRDRASLRELEGTEGRRQLIVLRSRRFAVPVSAVNRKDAFDDDQQGGQRDRGVDQAKLRLREAGVGG
jgi:hypothetical protein